MIRELSISNYKSIHDVTIELSNVNVFIGENGCGKTNILEAVAMMSASKNHNLNINNLSNMGVRVTKPALTLSSFLGQKQKGFIGISAKTTTNDETIKSEIYPLNKDDIYSEWGDYLKEKEIFSKINMGLSQISKKDVQLDMNDLDKKTRIAFTGFLSKLNGEDSFFTDYLIFNLNTQSLRGITNTSKEIPLGINGEGLDVLLNDFSKEEWLELKRYSYLISWLDEIVIDKKDSLKYQGHKLGRSTSILYFRDKYMGKKNNIFASENSNEGVLNILFYLALFISRKTPKFFAIDNIESSLNPKLCRALMKIIGMLAVEQNKQVLITTHNPAILDGMNLFDDNQRLFVVKRSDEGYTQVERVKLKPEVKDKDLKLSEMWMRGYLGGLPNDF